MNRVKAVEVGTELMKELIRAGAYTGGKAEYVGKDLPTLVDTIEKIDDKPSRESVVSGY